MTPTILPGDVFLIDLHPRHKSDPENGEIYVLNLEGGATVKRIEVRPFGLVVISDNEDKQTYPTDLVGDREPSEVIVGRVVWYGRYLSTKLR